MWLLFELGQTFAKAQNVFFFFSITFFIFGLKSTKILNHSHKEQQVGKFEKIRSFLD